MTAKDICDMPRESEEEKEEEENKTLQNRNAIIPILAMILLSEEKM
jgi:hypothetical protein